MGSKYNISSDKKMFQHSKHVKTICNCGCEPRIKVIVKIQKKGVGGGGEGGCEPRIKVIVKTQRSGGSRLGGWM